MLGGGGAERERDGGEGEERRERGMNLGEIEGEIGANSPRAVSICF